MGTGDTAALVECHLNAAVWLTLLGLWLAYRVGLAPGSLRERRQPRSPAASAVSRANRGDLIPSPAARL
jgi:hypothetical protein